MNHSKVYYESNRKIEFYRVGMAICAPDKVNVSKRKPPPKKAGSVIRGWSAHSRQRMREYMVTHCQPQGDRLYDVTLTVPGDPLSPVDATALFKDFSRWVQKQGWSSIWRIELQKRGAVHWHVLLSAPWEQYDRSPDPRDGFQAPAALQALHQKWFLLLMKYDRMTAHAVKYAILARPESFKGAGAWKWRQYMLDHASKAKQSQIATGYGRHWGVVGRGRFVDLVPESLDLSYRESVAFLRVLQKWARPTLQAPCVFGSRRGFRSSRGRRGRSVWFGNPALIRSAAEWVQRSNCCAPVGDSLIAPF